MHWNGYAVYRHPDGSFEAWRTTGRDEVPRDENDKKAGRKQVVGTESGIKRIVCRSASGDPITIQEACDMIDRKKSIKRQPTMQKPPEIPGLFPDEEPKPNVPSQGLGWNPNGE